MSNNILANFDTRLVHGSGDVTSRSFLLGEAPGKNEAETGIPFVGAAGKVLDAALAKSSVSRSEIYVTNAVKVRPFDNRTPNFEEIDFFFPLLSAEVERIDPIACLTLGKVATYALTGLKGPIGSYVGVPRLVERPDDEPLIVLPCYHPAATIYDRTKLSKFEEIVEDYINIWRYGQNRSFDEIWEYCNPSRPHICTSTQSPPPIFKEEEHE